MDPWYGVTLNINLKVVDVNLYIYTRMIRVITRVITRAVNVICNHIDNLISNLYSRNIISYHTHGVQG